LAEIFKTDIYLISLAYFKEWFSSTMTSTLTTFMYGQNGVW
jgi:hypothetical protein